MWFICVCFLLMVQCSARKSTNHADNNLCDSTEYAQNIYEKLRNNLYFSETYDIHQGLLIWVQNVTVFVGGLNPSGIYGSYKILPFGKYETENGILLRSSDAIVFGGCTAPVSQYYSWTENLATRYYNITNTSKLFAPLGDSLNHLVINTGNKSKSDPFNTLTTIITTGDMQTFDDINSILVSSNKNEINLRPIPNKWFNFLPYGVNWNESNVSFDTFIPILRIAIPWNESLYKQYISINQTVFYIEFKNASNGTNQPRIPLLNETRNTYSTNNINETAIYDKDLNQFQKDLVQNLTERYSLTLLSQRYFINKYRSRDYGFWCIENNQHCSGDTRDAQYWLHKPEHAMSNQSIYVVIGVNSFNVNLTISFQNFCLYTRTFDTYITGSNALTNFDYNGSAVNLDINTNVSEQVLSNFYVIQYGTRPFMLENIPSIHVDSDIYTKQKHVTMACRDYLNPITDTRPDYQQMIPPRIMIFSVVP